MAKLIIHSPEGRRETDLGNYTTMGRLYRNCIQITDRLISKEHCLIFLDEEGNYAIRDVGSRNGTFVNRQRIDGDTVLRHGDTITVGETSCIFESRKMMEKTPGIEERTTMLMSRIEEDRFRPETEIRDDAVLRSDYEKLRVAHELQRDIGHELDLDRIFRRILDRTFQVLNCDRAVILLADENGEMALQAAKVRDESCNLVVSSTIVKCVQNEKVGIISADALTDERFDNAESILIQHIRSSMSVPILYEKELLGIMIVDSSTAVRAYCEKDLELFGNVARQTAQFIKIARMAKRIEKEGVTRERFQRLLSPDLAERVVSGELKVEKGGQSRTATVLFADIRGFTSLCEDMRADEVLQMLNEYFELMVEIAFRYEGTVDKFVGDEIMLLWGTPVVHPDDPVRAVQAALEMQEALAKYNRIRRAKGHREIRIGIGINTGKLVAGYIGSSRTMSYSVIGDSVNIASRLCSSAKPDQILMTQDTRTQVSTYFDLTELEAIIVKGRSKPVNVYQVLGRKIATMAENASQEG